MSERIVYQDIKVVDGDEYDAFEAVLFPDTTDEDRRRGRLYGRRDEDAAVAYLAQWDHDDPTEEYDRLPRGTRTYRRGDYVLIYHTGLRQACLARRIRISD